MTSILEDMDFPVLGDRLRRARDAAGIKQADAAIAIGVVRPTLSAIEKGQRRVRVSELQKLAQLYGTSVNGLLRDEAIHVDLAPRFRKAHEANDEETLSAVQLLSDLAKAEVELENLLGVKRAKNYPPERPIARGDVRAQAENDANELRQRLGLGLSPIADIVTLLEFEMDVRVYIRRLEGRVSGLFAFDDALGPCILLNANHPKDRRTQTAAHECGHFISTRREPEVLSLGDIENSREERYANAFGPAFLTPARAVMQKFQDIVAGSETLSRRHVIVLAHYFNVSREAIVRRLEDLKLVKAGMWDWFEDNGGITDEQERQVLGDLIVPDRAKFEANKPTSLRLGLLAAEAYRQQLLSEGQLARLLKIDRLELRELFAGLEIEGGDADGVPILPD
jgi:Zn-dependent peptidase ImmA (M78 family)/transcriptional regulator with XRE-family HTH domain